ncbi:MAG TPA: DNA endonuclease SmrA [Gammaproteobacteria bacterium]|nr:DNA endonuclease SmrA [Gammaproteobacteria bacterium]HCY05098.1 DNA endonuclease SmrA [Gammaproteobacteria bacterium]|tara:strand:+ start:62 stop:655 length:594 start_codon:yes stop_codon:yes gene_type:complete
MNPDEDKDLFAEQMQDVMPLVSPRTEARQGWQGASEEQLQRRRAAEAFPEEDQDHNFLTLSEVAARQPLEVLEWKQDGVQHAVFSKLRRGGYALEYELDLHQKTVKEAQQAVFQLFQNARAKNWRCVLISHGKGQRSATPGRLKSYVARWLVDHPDVIAYSSAQRHHGGVGSVYVLVKKSAAGKAANREHYGLKGDL